jgi:hypothetical protein
MECCAHLVKSGKLHNGAMASRRTVPKMLNLQIGDRIGLVWRPVSVNMEPCVSIGPVFLVINGKNEYELAPSSCQPYPVWSLTGGVTQIQLLPESKR